MNINDCRYAHIVFGVRKNKILFIAYSFSLRASEAPGNGRGIPRGVPLSLLLLYHIRKGKV